MRRSGFYGLSVVIVAGMAAACTQEAPAPEPEAPAVEAAPEAAPAPEAVPAAPAPDAAAMPEGAPAAEGEVPNYDILPDGE